MERKKRRKNSVKPIKFERSPKRIAINLRKESKTRGGTKGEQFLSRESFSPRMKSPDDLLPEDILSFICRREKRNLTVDFLESIDDCARVTSRDRETAEFQRCRGWRESGTRIGPPPRGSDIIALPRSRRFLLSLSLSVSLFDGSPNFRRE